MKKMRKKKFPTTPVRANEQASKHSNEEKNLQFRIEVIINEKENK